MIPIRIARLLALVALSTSIYGAGALAAAFAQAPSQPGPYRVCSYYSHLDSDGYHSARLSHPCNLDDGPYPATTLTGGFTNTKRQMYWLANHLTTHGYIVITMTPNNIFGDVPVWERAHVAGINQLVDENRRWFSPVRGAIREDALGVMGYSKGGGGTLRAAASLGGRVETVVAMAPFLGPYAPDYMAIDAHTLILAGADDGVSEPGVVASYYQSLPTDIARGLATFQDVNHLDWINFGDRHDRFQTLITSWLEVYLDGDRSYLTYLDGAAHDRHRAQNWYSRYIYRP